MAAEIVVGIDFGTTYSGVSWAVNAGSKKVRIINDWPDPKASTANSEKVPSSISYLNGKPHNWGYNVDTATEQCFRWFKLLLESKHKFRNAAEPLIASTRLLGTLRKTPEEVASDYLRLIWEYTKEDIRRFQGDSWESMYTLKVVLTVPAIWSPAASEKTRNIAKAAGLPKNVTMVSEPEAAALAVLKDKNEEDSRLKIGDAFVVCDAGGGTVDLISYKVTGVEPLRLEECAVGDGDLCGSVYVDTAFEKHIKIVVGEQQYGQLRDKSKKKMLREFETAVKRSFSGDKKEYSVDLPGVEDNIEMGINDDTITLKPTMITTIFDHVINKISNLVDKQIDEVSDNGTTVKAILLVGGFGASKYLQKRLKSAHASDGIEVLQVNGAWSSICRGATLWGLENSSHTGFQRKTVSTRLARYSYGLCCAVPFDETIHLAKDKIQSPEGLMCAKDQMEWFLHKGDKIEEKREFECQFIQFVEGVGFRSAILHANTMKFIDELWYCAADSPPSRREIDVKQLCSVEYGIDYSKLYPARSFKRGGVKWRTPVFDLKIQLQSAHINFSVSYNDEAVAFTEAKYKEDS